MRIARVLAVAAAVASLAATALIARAYRQDLRRAHERIAHGSAIADTPCGPIEYAVAGRGAPVVVVHGAGGGFDQGMLFAEPLQRRGFRVIAMSRFGYLRTPLPADASAEAQADAHACLLDALGIGRAAFIGVSAGAPSSMQFALRHPGRLAALALLVPAAYVPRPGNAPPLKTPAATQFLFDTALGSDFLMWAGSHAARPTLVRAILATPPAVVEQANRAERARVAALLDGILPVSRRRAGLVNDAEVTSRLPRYALERIDAPTLLISVEDDLFGTFDGARYSARHIPRARFIGYPSGGHVWVGHHGEVLAELHRFLREAGGRPRPAPLPDQGNDSTGRRDGKWRRRRAARRLAPMPTGEACMNLIYSHNYASARAFALHHEFMPGDWKWLQDADVVRQHPRADVYKVERWETNPRRAQIDEALERARQARRLGMLVDVGHSSTLGVSGA